MHGFEINVLAKSRTATEKLVSLIRHSLATDFMPELKAKIRHFYDLYFLWNDPECKAYLRSEEFRKEFQTLLSSDQARFKEPKGWRDRNITDSPLITSFGTVWEELSKVYSKELPELAYQTGAFRDELGLTGVKGTGVSKGLVQDDPSFQSGSDVPVPLTLRVG